MEIKKTPVQIPLTWLHVWLLFAGIYGFAAGFLELDRKSTRLNSSHLGISYAVF